MIFYHYIKKKLTERLLNVRKRFVEFNQIMNSRKRIKALIRNNNVPKLTSQEDREAKAYFKFKGYTLKNTDWHAFYKATNGGFYENYIPLGMFNTKISPKLNQQRQWPALLDKNIIYRIFKGFEQPKRVLQNINGFYYINDKTVNLTEAINAINKNGKLLIIKPSIDTGGGKLVNAFTVNAQSVSYKNLSIEALLKLYKKDFIIQEFLEQSDSMNRLNSTSLNTLRVMSYLNEEGVQILSTVARVGGLNSNIDNYSLGGILCGIDINGRFMAKGYTKKGAILDKTFTGVKLSECSVPNYNLVIDMVKSMHVRIPYFKIVSWDIAISNRDSPVLIEYNTYNQGLEIQIVTGPLFGKFTDEILAKALE